MRTQAYRESDKRTVAGQGCPVQRLLLLIVCFLAASSSATGEAYDRWVRLQGAKNFRDIGGYDAGTTATVATRRVFRSDVLSSVTTGDAAVIRSLGIRTIIDLRYPPFTSDSALLNFTRHVYIPTMFPSATTTTETYRLLVKERGDQWRQAFDVLSNPANLPLDYHCHWGKDRTGVLTALILTLLGVKRETVIQDYLLTNVAFGPGYVDRRWIEAALDEVDKAGGIDKYLNSIGVTATKRRAVRANLLVLRPTGVGALWRLYR